jgi:hypothetical protein
MIRSFLIFFVFLAASYGQQRGMYGGISTGQIVGSINDPGFASRLGATVSGLPQTTTRIPVQRGIYSYPGGHVPGDRQGRGGWQMPRGGSRTLVVPFGGPVFFGGYGYSGYGYGYNYDVPPPQAFVQQPPTQPAPAVVINQYYSPEVVRPQMKDYTDLPEPAEPQTEKPKAQARVYPPSAVAPQPAPSAPSREEAERATITLLAFEDSSVVAALGYWMEGETLHYVTKNFEKKTAPLKSLDRALSEQLNRERNVEFKLEGIRGR